MGKVGSLYRAMLQLAAISLPKHRMRQIRCCLVVRADGVEARRLTPPQSDDLGEHKPHPVAGFPSGAQLGPHAIDYRLLSGDEASKVMGIGVGSGHGLRTLQ